MDRVGISFSSSMTADEVRERYVRPLRAALEAARKGIYTNYLRQADADSAQPAEHLLMFHVFDFQEGLHLLRVEIEKLGPPAGMMFHNLNPSDPAY